MRYITTILLIALVTIVTNGCGDPTEHVRSKLEEMDIEYPTDGLIGAVRNNDKVVVEVFIMEGFDMSGAVAQRALYAAIEANNREMVVLLLDAGVPPTEQALEQAAEIGDKQIVQLFLDAGALPTLDALMNATRISAREVAEMLLDTGTLPIQEALEYAAARRSASLMAELVLEAGAQPSNKALYIAVFNSNNKVGKILLDAGAPPTETEIILAIRDHNVQMAELLLGAGVLPSERALEAAAEVGSRQLVELLLEAGVPPTETALMDAIRYFDKEIIKLLLDAGVSPSEGALEYAAGLGARQVVELLLEAGAKPTEKAFEAAKRIGDMQMMKLLIDGDSIGRAIRDILKNVSPLSIQNTISEQLPDDIKSERAKLKKDWKVGQIFVDELASGGEGPVMIVLPAGKLLFERGRLARPSPTHMNRWIKKPQGQVIINIPFALSKYEVTNEQWDACVADGGCDNSLFFDLSRDWQKRRPVTGVTWEGAAEYAMWLSEQTGKHYRLPTEAEWEHAAGKGLTYDEWVVGTWAKANCDGCDERFGGKFWAAPVGQYSGNTAGLHDMYGNVYEWVQDCWNDSYRDSHTTSYGGAWETINCGNRVIRGGSWGSSPRDLNSKHRFLWRQSESRLDLGIRLARDLDGVGAL